MIKKTFWSLSIIIVMLSSCAYYNTFYNAQLYFEEGIKDYKESLEKNNKNFSKKNFNLAIEKSRKILIKYPDSKWCDDAQYLIAVSNYYKANYRKSKKGIELFLENYPDSDLSSEMKMWYGRVFWKMGSPEMAIHHWQQMVNETKDQELQAHILYSIAEVFEDIDKPDSAIVYYEKVTNVRGGSDVHGQAQYNIAELFLKLGNMEKAVENVEKVGQFNVETELKQKRQVLLLKIYRTAGKYEKAEKLIYKKLNDEKNKDIWDELEVELGLLYRDLGDTSAAISRFQNITENESYKKSKSAAAAFYYLGMINLVDVHDYKKAEQNFSLVQKENKESEFVFEANQRTQQLKRFDSIQEQLLTNKPLVNQVIKDLNTPEDEKVVEVDSVDKSQEEIKKELEEAESATSVANIDTLTVFDEFYKSRYELAEIYYFDFNFKDSGKVILNEIVQSPYFNPYIEQSIYALYYISKLENDDESANAYYAQLKSKNSDSPFISFIETGKIQPKEKYEKEKSIFIEAETNISTDADKSITLFKMLLDDYPENPFQGRAAVNIAWIMENKKYDLDSSLFWYKTVIDSFSMDESVQLAREKYGTLIQLKEPVVSDSPVDSAVIATNPMKPDTTMHKFKSDSLRVPPEIEKKMKKEPGKIEEKKTRKNRKDEKKPKRKVIEE